MISWNFPGNQDGQVKGVADAGIENFNGTELSSLARENCQNSLDAALNDSNPDVLVEFERYFVPSKQIPGIMEYRNILKKCKDFWDRSKSEKAKLFFPIPNAPALSSPLFAPPSIFINAFHPSKLKSNGSSDCVYGSESPVVL